MAAQPGVSAAPPALGDHPHRHTPACPIMGTLPLLPVTLEAQLSQSSWEGSGEEGSGKSTHPHTRNYTRAFSPRNPESPLNLWQEMRQTRLRNPPARPLPAKVPSRQAEAGAADGVPLPQGTGRC